MLSFDAQLPRVFFHKTQESPDNLKFVDPKDIPMIVDLINRHNPSKISIDMCNLHLGNEAIGSIAKTLTLVKRPLKSLILNENNVSFQDEESIKHFTSIAKSISFVGCSSLTGQIGRLCMGLQTNTIVTSLNLSNIDLSRYGLANLLLWLKTSKVDTLTLRNCNLGKHEEPQYTSVPMSLTHLDVSSNPYLCPGGRSYFNELLSLENSIEVLKIDKCEMDKSETRMIMHTIRTNQTLVKLSINRAIVGMSTLGAIFYTLMENNTLRSLTLWFYADIPIPDAVHQHISHTIQKYASLVYLNISDNGAGQFVRHIHHLRQKNETLHEKLLRLYDRPLKHKNTPRLYKSIRPRTE